MRQVRRASSRLPIMPPSRRSWRAASVARSSGLSDREHVLERGLAGGEHAPGDAAAGRRQPERDRAPVGRADAALDEPGGDQAVDQPDRARVGQAEHAAQRVDRLAGEVAVERHERGRRGRAERGGALGLLADAAGDGERERAEDVRLMTRLTASPSLYEPLTYPTLSACRNTRHRGTRRRPARPPASPSRRRSPARPQARRPACPNCGEESATWRAQCPACNKRYDRRLPWLSDRARWVLGIVGAIAAIAALWAILPGRLRRQATERREGRPRGAAARRGRARAADPRAAPGPRPRARPRALPADAPAAERLAQRRALVGQTEAAILAEARKRIATGELDGPVAKVNCGPLVRTPDNARDENDLSKRLGRYDCVAVKRDVVDADGKVVGPRPPVRGDDRLRAPDLGPVQGQQGPGRARQAAGEGAARPSCVGAGGQQAVGNGYAAPDS